MTGRETHRFFLLLVLFSAVPTASAVDVTVYGPVEYARGRGAPATQISEFLAFPGPAILSVENGSALIYDRVRSGAIYLNGAKVAGSHNFGARIDSFEFPVNLHQHNTLAVQIRRRPGARLILRLRQDLDSDVQELFSFEGGSVEVVSVGNPLDGVEVLVPENAFSELTLLSVARAPAELPMPNRLAPVLEGFIIDADIRPERDVLARIPVPDDDADGLIDGTELEPHQIDLYRYIPESDTFRLVRTLYDEASRSFEATVDHFSYFRFASIIRYDRDQTLKYRISRFPEHLASGYTAENVKASIRRAFDIYEQELDCYGIDFEETDGAAEFTFQLHKSLAATGVDADIQRISMHLGDVG